jgi:hypothetical protein
MTTKLIHLLAIIVIFMACGKSITSTSKSTQSKVTINTPLSKNGSKASVEEEVVVMPSSNKFPDSWFGTWAGELKVYNAKGLAQTVPMECKMGKTDTAGVYEWSIIYGTDREKGLRPYILRTIDASKGHYLCDELNTIKMESYLLGNKLFCNYSVMGNWMTSIYEKTDDGKMIFEIIFGKEKAVSESGGEIVKGDTVPVVKAFPVIINQKAVLTRKP